MEHVLICGVSTRAAAESAARAGFRATAIDAYADLDQHPAVRALSVNRDCGQPPTARGMARAARQIEADAVAYLSNFENHPSAVAMLAAGRRLWGNPPDVLRRVRNPRLLAEAFGRHGFPVPAIRSTAANANDPNAPNDPSDWLEKPLHSGGGHRVRAWTRGTVRRGCYLQQRIEGTPGSVVFVAARGRAVVLGVSRQLVGDPAFGAAGFRYCGNIVAPSSDAQFARGGELVARARALAEAAAAEFGLLGVNGIDFIAAGGVPYPVELNPRWSASLELVGALVGVPVFRLHADACVNGTLPSLDPCAELGRGEAVGKAIVYAHRDIVVGDTHEWLEDSTVRDVPHSGERFAAGQPICTVLARAADASACYHALVERADRIYRQCAAAHV